MNFDNQFLSGCCVQNGIIDAEEYQRVIEDFLFLTKNPTVNVPLALLCED